MGSVRVIVVSDSHLSETTAEASANWDAVVDHVAAVRPDLVVHAGDITADGRLRADELGFARAQLDRLAAPVVVVPGNHDVGDTPGVGPSDEPVVDADRLGRFREVFGADRFSAAVGRWRLIGIDAQLLTAGGPDEAEQWDWLEGEVAALAADTAVAVVSHKPFVPAPGDTDTAVHYVGPAARERLFGLLGAVDTRLAVSGHIHQALRHRRAGVDHVWAPTTWAVLPGTIQRRVGVKAPGIVDLALHDGGQADVVTRVPDGMRHLVLGVDVVDPYDLAARQAAGG